jgi:restriction endonuclease Mrr
LERLRKQLICNLEVLCVRGNPRQFEELIAELFRRLGYQVYLTAQSNDGGKDIICKLNDSTTYVECKFFSPGQKVGRPHLQKLAGAMTADRVTKGKCVTTGTFTQQATAYAQRVGIELWDIHMLSNIIAEKFPERRMPLTYTELCHACGGAVEFELFNPVHVKKCANSHDVQKTIFGKDALPDFVKSQWGTAR